MNGGCITTVRGSARRRVGIYRSVVPMPSESFVLAQARTLQRWEPIFLTDHPAQLGTSEVTRSLAGTSLASDLSFRLSRYFRFTFPHTVEAFRGLQLDLVHAHFGTGAVDIWPLVRALGLPLVTTLHGYDINIKKDWWEGGNGGKRRRAYPSQLISLASEPQVTFVAASRAVLDAAVRFGIPQEKLHLSYIGVSSTLFTPGTIPIAKRHPTILFIGRLQENKGPHILLEAFRLLSKRIPEASLIIAGDGPMRDSLERSATGLRVRFLGVVSQDGVNEALQHARVLCQPSITIGNGASEGFGLAILEAQAAGVPVVSSACGGSREGMLEGISGFRFEEGSSSEAADALARILTDDSLATSMSIAARGFVLDRFRLSNCTKRLESIYDLAVRGAPQC